MKCVFRFLRAGLRLPTFCPWLACAGRPQLPACRARPIGRATLLRVLAVAASLGLAGSAGAVSIAQSPLLLAAKVDPNVMIALSVEWPTAETAAYSDNAATDPAGNCAGLLSDSNAAGIAGSGPAGVVGLCYYENETYVGYFDAAKCYAYDLTNHWFYPTGTSSATTHECSGAWSGNLLNWATMTTLDEFRWAMTGGSRVVDSPGAGSSNGVTVLRRTYKNFGPNTYVFRVKRITPTATTNGSTTVPGVPSSKVTPLSTDTTLYFGSNGQNLFVWTPAGASLPSSTVWCAAEGGTCVLPAGSYTVWFGAGTNWTTLPARSGSVACNNTSFGDPDYGHSKACYYTTSSSGIGLAWDNGTVTMTSDQYDALVPVGGFQAQVKVCDPSIGLEANCASYVNGTTTTYKPTGLMQTYASSMRFAVSSYLYDTSAAHNGGVLRSNMKYVGPYTKDPTNGTTTNTAAEWDANGVFVANPNASDATASGLSCTGAPGCSGVTNFINGFGYSSQSYMAFDVLSELYYESLRYFVAPADGPTQAYVTAPWNSGGVTASEKDGFPVVTSWNDPIQYACQNNSIITVGDSNTWCDFNLPGSSLSDTAHCSTHGSYSLANQAGASESWANVTSFANSVGSFEGLGTLGSTWGGGLYDTYYIAGLAWWAHTHSIRSAVNGTSVGSNVVNVTSYFIDVREPGSWGTSGSGINQYWLGAKYGGFTLHNATSPELTPTTTSDWENGSLPKTYFYGNQPLALISSLNSMFNSIKSNAGSEASLAANSVALQTGDHVYQAVADPSDWSGHLKAYDVTSSGSLSTTYIDAATLLAAPVAANRVIFTSSDSSGAGIPFEWSSLPASAQAALNTSPAGTTDSLGSLRLNYLRGDASHEGTSTSSFRPRSSTKLGDIVDSAPVYVGATKPDGSARTPMVYVGANDGMLHAFSAGAVGDLTTTTGTTMMQEKFAFVPSVLMPQLTQLTSVAYNHRYFVDGSPQVAEAAVGGTAKTVLAGGLHGGGAGVYALDVTSPDTLATGESAAANALLWQFTSTQDADLGYTFSDPQIVRTAALDSSGRQRWAVVTGNGYKAAQASGTTTIQAALFILFLDHPSGGTTWVAGTDYVKLTTSVTGVTTAAPNGMSTPAVVNSSTSGAAAYVYAGDLYGNLWKFDISSTNTAQWKSALDSSTPARTPLFVAQTAAGVAQPITVAPEVASYPRGGYIVMFGTGIALSSSDLGSTALQTLYGIHDDLSGTAVPGRASSSAALVQQQILTSSLTFTNSNGSVSHYRAISSNPVNYSTMQGWYLDLVDSPTASASGERLVFNPFVYQGRVFFTTVVPNTTNCGGGTSWNLALSPYTGGSTAIPVYDVNGDGLFSSADMLSYTSGSTTASVYPAGLQSGSGITPPAVLIASSTGCGSNRCHDALQTSNSGVMSSRMENDGTAYQRATWREIPNQ